MDIVPAPLARLGSILLGIIIVIAAYNFWKMKKSGKNISQALAEKFAKNGLSKDSTPRKPSNFGSTVKNVAGTGMKMYHRSRMLRAAKAGATVATAVGTAGAGVAAAKAGTTMASHAGTAMASRAGIRAAGTTAAGALNPAATQGAIPPPQSQSELPAGPDPAAAHQPLALNAPLPFRCHCFPAGYAV